MHIFLSAGEPSGDLVDVDLDCPEALELAPFFLPGTGCSFGREGKPRSHLLFTSAIPSTVQHSDPEADKDMLVELRSTGGQTVFPGSVHATGEATRSGTSTALNATIGCTLPSSISVKSAALMPRTGRPAPSRTVASIWMTSTPLRKLASGCARSWRASPAISMPGGQRK